jgi:hypothetical protein
MTGARQAFEWELNGNIRRRRVAPSAVPSPSIASLSCGGIFPTPDSTFDLRRPNYLFFHQSFVVYCGGSCQNSTSNMVYCRDKKVATFTIIFLVFSSQLLDAAQKPQRQASQDMPTRAPECLVLHLLSLALRPEWRHLLSVGGELGSTSTSSSTSVRIPRPFPIHRRTDITDTTSAYSKP